VTLAQLEAEFGKEVASLVSELTRREPLPSEVEGLTADEVWLLRAGLLLEDVVIMSDRAKIIKLCDRLSNLREAVRTKKGDKLTRYAWQTHRILKAIPRELSPELWDQLDAVARQASEA